MGKFIAGMVTIVAVTFLAGWFPTLAVGLTAILIVGLFTVFK